MQKNKNHCMIAYVVLYAYMHNLLFVMERISLNQITSAYIAGHFVITEMRTYTLQSPQPGCLNVQDSKCSPHTETPGYSMLATYRVYYVLTKS